MRSRRRLDEQHPRVRLGLEVSENPGPLRHRDAAVDDLDRVPILLELLVEHSDRVPEGDEDQHLVGALLDGFQQNVVARGDVEFDRVPVVGVDRPG